MKNFVINLIILSQFFIGQACFAEQFTRLGTLIDKGKVLVENIVDGAYETLDDLKEVYDEVSVEFADKAKEGYEKITTKIDLKKYLIQQIGEAEVTFFQIVRKVNNAIQEFSPKIKTWLTEHAQKDRIFNQEEINEFALLIDSKTHEKIALEMIEQIHTTDAFKNLMHHDNEEFKRVQFEFLFALYANAILDQYKDNFVDAYAGLGYTKLLLEYELKISLL